MSELVYNQIEKFYQHKETKNDSKNIGEKYFYVDTQKATSSADFFSYLKEAKKINLSSNLNIMDLCFGSGNLSSHILLDVKLKIDNIYFNDIDTHVTNQDIKIDGKSKILSLDFLDFKQFEVYKNSINIVIFNPTISDGDIHRKISIKENDNIVLRDIKSNMTDDFKDYCEELSLDMQEISINDSEQEIKIEVKGNKSELNKLPNSFNNYTINCKTTKMENYENKASTVSKINQTISTILKDDGLIIFVGTDKQREVIFQNYHTVYRYLRDDNDVFVIKQSKVKILECYEKEEDTFIVNKDCEIKKELLEIDVPFDEISIDLNNFEEKDKSNINLESEVKVMETEEKLSNEKKGNLDFPHKNILFKGVPGTGKSRTVDNIIQDADKLNMKELPDNVLRINIHSASSNSDLMQGISISTDENQNILYKEKQGSVLKHIIKAIYKPFQPFVLVLEEIQENSLNELIGDLIYLIEDTKRTIVKEDEQTLSYDELIKLVSPEHFVELPSLVESSDTNTKMIIPNNLYIFCTSNYRDDKKVIEDNLLRRFDVIEMYPKYGEIFKSKDVSDFLKILNEEILKSFSDETHPDRNIIGHANWLKITDEESDENRQFFYKALLKVVIEFKEIREVEFDSFVKPLFSEVFQKDDELSERINSYLEIFYIEDKLNLSTYKEIVETLQQEIYSSFI